ncbi:hypothetical protein HA757_000173 [Salmonella enterica]|nr:hypothetical protein [Salmonella enterica]
MSKKKHFVKVFPAPAGINRSLMAKTRAAFCVPRASGDKPVYYRPIQYLIGCSPRQRG